MVLLCPSATPDHSLKAPDFRRPGELRNAKRSEVDREAAIWSIPACRRNMSLHRRVSLDAKVALLLHGLVRLTGNGDLAVLLWCPRCGHPIMRHRDCCGFIVPGQTVPDVSRRCVLVQCDHRDARSASASVCNPAFRSQCADLAMRNGRRRCNLPG